MTRLAILFVIVALLVSCSSPVELKPVGYKMITAYGELSVDQRIAFSTAAGEIDQAAERVAAQGYELNVNGVRVFIGDCGGGSGQYLGRGQTCVVDEQARALDHELMHAMAERLGRTGECLRCQDHKGYLSGDPDTVNDTCPVGYNLDCEVVRV